MSEDYDNHPVCRCGCGELADECPQGSWVGRLFPREAQQDSRRFDLRAGEVR